MNGPSPRVELAAGEILEAPLLRGLQPGHKINHCPASAGELEPDHSGHSWVSLLVQMPQASVPWVPLVTSPWCGWSIVSSTEGLVLRQGMRNRGLGGRRGGKRGGQHSQDLRSRGVGLQATLPIAGSLGDCGAIHRY